MVCPRPSRILVGPAGWSYPDWEGVVYPRNKPRGFHEAGYLAGFFDTIEINTSFYSPVRPELSKLWVEKVQDNSRFRFTAKLWKRFTHERTANRQDEKVFKKGMEPLCVAGRLGTLLLQFPWSFKNTPENHAYLSGLFMQFLEYPLVLEVRHSSWNKPDVYEWLAQQGVGFCNIDQPEIGRPITPGAHRTAPVGYVRLYGGRSDQWFISDDHPEERYQYLYTLDELRPWAARIQKVAQHTDVTFVVANNHHEGKAIANALQLTSILRGQPVRVPETVKKHFPELESLAAPGEDAMPHTPEQAGLFLDTSQSRNDDD